MIDYKKALKRMGYVCGFISVFTFIYGAIYRNVFDSDYLLILMVVLFVAVALILLALSEVIERLESIDKQDL